MNIKGKTALITGRVSGIGLEAVGQFLTDGAGGYYYWQEPGKTGHCKIKQTNK